MIFLYAFTYISGVTLITLGLVPLWVGVLFSLVLGFSLRSLANKSVSTVTQYGLPLVLLTYLLSRFLPNTLELVAVLTLGIVIFSLDQVGKRTLKWNNKALFASLVGVFVLALALRAINLTNLYPYTDEYAHLVAGKTLVNEGGIEYTRARFVTNMVSLGYLIGQPESFQEYLFWGRLPGAVFSSLTVVPIYLLGSKVSKKVGLIAAILWAISPWSIGVGRAVREYAYYPVFTTSFLYLVWVGYDRLFTKKFNFKKFLLCAYAVAVFLIYALLIDFLSTLKISLLMFIAFTIAYGISNFKVVLSGINTVRNQDWFSPIRPYFPYLTIGTIITIVLGVGIYAFNSPHASLSELTLRPVWADYFFRMNNLSVLNWWDESGYGYSLILILFGLVQIIQNKKQRSGLGVISIAFASLLLFYVAIFDRYARPRYIFHLVPLYTIFISMGVTGIVNYFTGYSRKLGVLLMVAVFITIFPFDNATFAIRSREHGYIDTTNEFHNDISQSLSYIEKHVKSDDVVIGTIMVDAVYLAKDIEKKNLYRYSYKDKNRYKWVSDIVSRYESGWMILDSRRNGQWSKGYPHQGAFLIANKKVTVEQNLEGIQIYRW